YLDTSNADPKPFVWTKTADQILAKIARFARATLEDHGLDESRDTSETGH
ncbi:MAG: IS630 family transposase, partial [Polyangiaceae bacterium]